MDRRLHPYSFNPWVSQRSFAKNPYGAYYPLPVAPEPPFPVVAVNGTQRCVTNHKSKRGSQTRPPRLPLNSRPPNKNVLTEDPLALRGKPTKKYWRKGSWRRRSHQKYQIGQNVIPQDPSCFPARAFDNEQPERPPPTKNAFSTPSSTPYSSFRCTGDDAQLNVNPYGTMAGMIELEPGASPLFLQNEEGEDESSVDGPSSTSSEGGVATADEHRQPSQARVLPQLRVSSLQDFSRYGDTFLRVRLEEQEVQLNQLEEENLTLKERLFLAQQELEELRRRTSGSSLEDMDGDNSVIWGEGKLHLRSCSGNSGSRAL